jgi:hypothetical protein
MNDLYEAIGTIAAAAHANGDRIDENIRPEDNYNLTHGFEIIHKSNYMRIGKHREQRFEITSPYFFLNILQRNYSDSELHARANRDLDSLPPEERQQTIESVLEEDLREASAQYEAFGEAFSKEIAPTDTDLIKITRGEEDLWNGFFVRDHIYPMEDSFSIAEYRQVVSKVRRVRIEATQLAHEVIDVFDAANSEELTKDPESTPKTDHYMSSPGFQ